MLACRDAVHNSANFLVGVPVFIASLGNNHFIGDGNIVYIKLETGIFVSRRDNGLNSVGAFLFKVYGVFHPVARFRVTDNQAFHVCATPIDINALIHAEICVALVVAASIAIGVVAKADTSLIVVFCLNRVFYVNDDSGSVIGFLFLFFGVDNFGTVGSDFYALALAQIVLEIFFEPDHGGALLTVWLDDTGVGRPSRTVDVAPDGNARNPFCFPHKGNLVCIVILLSIVIGLADVVFRNEQG